MYRKSQSNNDKALQSTGNMTQGYKLLNLNKVFRDDLIKRIVKNSGIILSGNLMASALSLISFTIMARQLGPETFAILVLAQTYALIINDIFNVQTWESMVKFGSAQIGNDRIINVIKSNLFIDIISAVVAFIFAIILIRPVAYILHWDDQNLFILSLYSLSILFNITTFTIGIPRLFNKFFAIARIQVVMAAMKLICVLGAVYYGNMLIVYFSIYLGIDILTNLFLFIFSLKVLKVNYGLGWMKNKISIDKEQIRFLWWTNLRTIIRIPVRHFDMIVVSSVISMNALGIYKVYKEIAGLINRVGDPVNQSIYPEFAKLIGKNSLAQTVSITKKSIFLLSGVSIGITFTLILISKFLIATFFGVEYIEHINALYILFVLFGVSFFTVPINSLFIAAGFAKYSFILVLFTNIIYLIIAFGFGKIIGIYGIVLAFGVQMVLNKGLKIFLLKRYSNDWGTVVR